MDQPGGKRHHVKNYDLLAGSNQIGDVTGGFWPVQHGGGSHLTGTPEYMRAAPSLQGGDYSQILDSPPSEATWY